LAEPNERRSEESDRAHGSLGFGVYIGIQWVEGALAALRSNL
jgi:hypothetical protein